MIWIYPNAKSSKQRGKGGRLAICQRQEHVNATYATVHTLCLGARRTMATAAATATATSATSQTREERIEALLRAQDSLLSGAFLDAAAGGAEARSSLGRKEQQPQSGAGLRRCRPWSRDDMLERARTFRVGLWSAPPPGLRPLECARRGWFADGAPDTLGCSCGARLVFARPETGQAGSAMSDADVLASADGGEPGSAALERAVIERVVQALRTGHKPECPWRDSACPATFLGLPPLEPKATLTALQCRVKTHIALPSQQLPRVVPLTDLGVSAEERGLLYASLGVATSTPDDSPQGSAAALALFGWSACPPDNSDTNATTCGSGASEEVVLTCELCFRHVGCWNFQRHGVEPGSSRAQKRPRISTAASSESSQATSGDLLDPIREHRAFCPYVDVAQPSLAAAPGATPAHAPQPGYRFILASLRGQPGRAAASNSNADGC